MIAICPVNEGKNEIGKRETWQYISIIMYKGVDEY